MANPDFTVPGKQGFGIDDLRGRPVSLGIVTTCRILANQVFLVLRICHRDRPLLSKGGIANRMVEAIAIPKKNPSASWRRDD